MASSLSRTRAALILGTLAAPTLLFACELTPLQAPAGATTSTGSDSSSTTSATTSSSGGGATSTSTGSGGQGGATSSSTTTSASTSSTSATTSTTSTGAGGADGGCNTITQSFTPDSSPHIPVCSPVTYSTNPPTSGPHYPIWAQFKTYTTPVERGFYVHDLEHGAVVILYNCPTGCEAELDQLATFLAARPADPLCTAPVKSRVVVTPDPLIDTKFAAAAWGTFLKSDCLDLTALGAFMDAHYGMGPEILCADGLDVTAPDAGLPAGCGN